MIFRKGFVCLRYHSVNKKGAEIWSFGKPLLRHLSITPEKFEKQIIFLKKKNCHFLSLSEILKIKKGIKKFSKKSVLIYFDDGYKDNFTFAYPILKKHNVPAAIFVATDYISTRGFLSWHDINAMKDIIELGSHTKSHSKLVNLSPQKVKEELQKSKELIEDKAGQKIFAVSYPKGRTDEYVFKISADIGYELGIGSLCGQNGADADFLNLKKSVIFARDPMWLFKLKARGSLPCLRFFTRW